MIFVDSSVWIDFFNGNATHQVEILHKLLGREPLVIGDIVLAEVLQGFRHDRDSKVAQELLSSLRIVNVLNTKIALQSAKNFRLLRQRGITVRKTLDSIIATYCISNRLFLLHSDRDFEPFEKHLGLKVVS
ncbi:MAG: putative nucleic acid-binding protein [Rhodothermales bacterium]